MKACGYCTFAKSPHAKGMKAFTRFYSKAWSTIDFSKASGMAQKAANAQFKSACRFVAALAAGLVKPCVGTFRTALHGALQRVLYNLFSSGIAKGIEFFHGVPPIIESRLFQAPSVQKAHIGQRHKQTQKGRQMPAAAQKTPCWR